jgi:Flp pilus assembly protein TadG
MRRGRTFFAEHRMESETMTTSRRHGRRGTVVPYLALTIVALLGFLALAIDLGMVALAKAQAQNAADLAALTAMRTVTGDPTVSYNVPTATTNAQNVLSYNAILGQAIQPSQLALTYGTYDYDQTSQTFIANYPGTSGRPTTAATATVTTTSLPGAFSTVFGSSLLPNVTATSQAVHRPRDIAMVADLSGSMRMGTCLGYDFYTSSRTTNNPDTAVPTFGHYSGAGSSLTGTSTGRTSAYDNYTISPSNSTAGNSSYTLTYVNNFYQNAAYASTLVRAFDSYTSTDGGTTWSAGTGTPTLPPSSYTSVPGGDVPLFKSGSTTTYATDVSDVLNGSSVNYLWELDGYSAYSAGKPDTSGTGSVPAVWTAADYSGSPFNGYTRGPNYYGKTFFLWPPDPRTTTALSGSTLTTFLGGLGINSTDQSTLSAIWSTWQGQGATGLTNLQNWLKGTAKGGASSLPTFAGAYTPTSTTALVPSITTWNGTTLTSANKPKTYYAVCRLFNRAYPGGAAWTSTSFTADWRVRFFGTNDNTKLFNSSGSLNAPGSSGLSSAATTYNAILAWLAASPNPFPTQMRAGRVKYYGSIPTSITGSWPSYGGTDQRFWVEIIDYTLGFKQTAAGTYTNVSAYAGYGSDFTWGTKQTSSPPSAPQSVSYTDNPLRPLLRHWFGPLLMTDYLQNYNMECNTSTYFTLTPADSYEAPQYTAKEAFVAAVNTMESNHPNDWFALVPFSWPRNGNPGTIAGRFNCVGCPMGTNYAYGRSSLLFPFSTINADGTCNNTEITPYDADPATSRIPSANFVDTGRADGDTCFAMALMLCYNQFAVTPSTDTTLRTFVTGTPITFPTGMAGGMGRKGAQKVIIFETDGLPNTAASASLITAPAGYTYYQIRYDMNRPASSEYPSVTVYSNGDTNVTTQVYSLVSSLATTYGTQRNPFRLYAIGFGPVFAGTDASTAETILQTMQYKAGTQSSASTPLPSNQIITGTGAQMSSNMITSYKTILQSGVQIALIK